jgi:predicted RNA binding protein YcfA (HicA-like mRNA interferase family)
VPKKAHNEKDLFGGVRGIYPTKALEDYWKRLEELPDPKFVSEEDKKREMDEEVGHLITIKQVLDAARRAYAPEQLQEHQKQLDACYEPKEGSTAGDVHYITQRELRALGDDTEIAASLENSWWKSLTPKQKKAYLLLHPASRYARPPYQVKAEHVHAIIAKLKIDHPYSKQTLPEASRYTRTKHRFTVNGSDTLKLRNKVQKQLKDLGFVKSKVKTSNHFQHPDSKAVVNLTYQQHPKDKNKAIMQLLHIHPTKG